MANKYKDRIKILEDHEIDELYGLPKFNADERAYYFSLTQKEQEIAQSHRTQENRVLFILQIGYFKAKTMFFSFVFKEVHNDVQYVLRQYFPLSGDIRLTETILRQTKHTQQQKILELYGYRICSTDERNKLLEKALQIVKISAKPVYLFQSLIHYLENEQIILPGYSLLQDMVSQVLATERQRLTEILERSLNDETRTVLENLYVSRDGIYGITELKHEPKDFSLKEIKGEILRCQSLSCLYQTAKNLMPTLDISNDSVAYYSTLIDYYTVQKLQQMPTGMVHLYLLCFILHRYHRLNDNLVNALIFHVRKVINTAKAAAKEKILTHQLENNESIFHVSKILALFLDESIPEEAAFRDIKKRAFAILDEDKFKQVSQYLQG